MTTEVQHTIDERIDHINLLTQAVKESFFEIARQMKAIKEECGLNQKGYLALMEERTGYKKVSVYRFLRAYEAQGNLIDFCAHVGTFPEEEATIRPLATKKLNEDPELQAEIWTEVVEEAGDANITAAMVKAKVKAKTKKPEPPPTNPDDIPEEFRMPKGEKRNALEYILKAAKRAAAKEFHPDTHPEGVAMMVEVNNLLDEIKIKYAL